MAQRRCAPATRADSVRFRIFGSSLSSNGRWQLVVRRVFVYALTTLGIALLIGGVVYTAGLYAFGSDQSFSSGEIALRVVIAVLAMAAIVMRSGGAGERAFCGNKSIDFSTASDMTCLQWPARLRAAHALSATTALRPPARFSE